MEAICRLTLFYRDNKCWSSSGVSLSRPLDFKYRCLINHFRCLLKSKDSLGYTPTNSDSVV